MSPFVRSLNLAISDSLCIRSIDSCSLGPLWWWVWTMSSTMTDTMVAIRAVQSSCQQLDSSQSHWNSPYHGLLHETQVVGSAVVICFHTSHSQKGGVLNHWIGMVGVFPRWTLPKCPTSWIQVPASSETRGMMTWAHIPSRAIQVWGPLHPKVANILARLIQLWFPLVAGKPWPLS